MNPLKHAENGSSSFEPETSTVEIELKSSANAPRIYDGKPVAEHTARDNPDDIRTQLIMLTLCEAKIMYCDLCNKLRCHQNPFR